MKNIKYPDDFAPFEGKALSSDEINDLIKDAKKHEGGLETGDTRIEIDDDGNITVYQNRAFYAAPPQIKGNQK